MLTGIKLQSTYGINQTTIFAQKHMDDNPVDTDVELLAALVAEDDANQNQRLLESVERMTTNRPLSAPQTAIVTALFNTLNV